MEKFRLQIKKSTERGVAQHTKANLGDISRVEREYWAFMKISSPPALVASPVSSVAGHSVELPCDARPSIKGDQVISLHISIRPSTKCKSYKETGYFFCHYTKY